VGLVPIALLFGDILRYASPAAIVGFVLTGWRWRSDRRWRRRDHLQRIGLLVSTVQNAAGEALILPTAGHIEEPRRVSACRYALNNLRVALAVTKEPLPRCRELVAIERVVPRTIETMVWPMAGLARDEIDHALGLTPVADAPSRNDVAA
jgi:hypothetical protein